MLNSDIDEIMKYFKLTDRITLVEGKREDQTLLDSMSEAIGKAIALSEVTKSVQFIHNHKTPAERLLQYKFSSILPIGWAKLGIFAVDKG